MSKKNYEVKMNEVENIIVDLQIGEMSVEKVVEKIKVATGYLNDCHQKITETENSVNDVLKDLNKISNIII
jgi:exodeoxyribonuclease VII small subunit